MRRREVHLPRGLLPQDVLIGRRTRALRSPAHARQRDVHWSQLDRGGHFAAMDAPDLLVADLRKFFRRFR